MCEVLLYVARVEWITLRFRAGGRDLTVQGVGYGVLVSLPLRVRITSVPDAVIARPHQDLTPYTLSNF